MHIACSISKSYVQHCSAMILSLLQSTNAEEIHIHIFHRELDHNDETLMRNLFINKYNVKFKFYEIDEKKLASFPIVAEHLSIQTLYRLLLGKLIPKEVEKVIYIDSDIIIKDDLLQIWEIDIQEYPVAAVVNLEGIMYQILELDHRLDYFNAGFMLINLRKWREQNYFDKFLTYTEENYQKLIFADQDILNGVLRGNWLKLHPKWNVQNSVFFEEELFLNYFNGEIYQEIVTKPSVIHYTGMLKPWNFINYQVMESDYFYYLYQLEPWKDFLPMEIAHFKNKGIYIFGTGDFSRKIYEKCSLFNLNIEAFLDNDPLKWGKLFNGKKIIKPVLFFEEKLTKEAVVVVASMYAMEIIKGIKEDFLIDSKIELIDANIYK